MTDAADLRIGVVCPYDLAVPGGVQSHVIDMVAGLAARGVQVNVLAPVGETAAIGRRFGQWPHWLTNAGPARQVRINGSSAPVCIARGQREQVRAWLRHTGATIAHVHEPFVPALARPAVHAASGAGLPVVGTFHAAVDSTALLLLARPLLRRTLSRLTAAVPVSEAAAATVAAVRRGVPATIIANPVDVSNYSRAVLSKPSPGRQGGQVLFLGRGDEPRKGLDDLLAAWPLIRAARPHAALVIAGRMQRSDFPDGAVVLGEVSAADKPGVYAGADVYVAPNRGGESMGMVLVEAMASGTAVIATDLPAFTAVSEGRAARHTPVADPVALASAVVAVLDDDAERARLVAAGLKRAADYDVSRIAESMIEVYRRCLR